MRFLWCFSASNGGGTGTILGQGTKTHMPHSAVKKLKKKKENF